MIRWIIVSLTMTLAVLAVMSYVGFGRPDLLREKIPIHWDINFEPDGWTDRAHVGWHLLAFPGFMLLMVLLMFVLPWLSPKNFEIDRFAGTFGFVMTSVIALFGYLGILVLWAAIDETPAYWGQCFVAGFFVMFAVMGNVMGKVQRNFWMGIRTPWTLANETVWNRTHRVAAWLWVIAGVGGGIAVICGAPFWSALIVIIVAALWPAVYSLILYKSLQKQGKL